MGELTTYLSNPLTSTNLSSDEPETLSELGVVIPPGWEMPDLRSPQFSQRPKCAGVATHENGLFFPEQKRWQKTSTGGPMTPQQMALDAKAFCWGTEPGDHVCPVRNECLDWAMENWQRYGVWGGLSEPERAKLKDQHEAERERRLETTAKARNTRLRRQYERARGYWLPWGPDLDYDPAEVVC